MVKQIYVDEYKVTAVASISRAVSSVFCQVKEDAGKGGIQYDQDY